jgi:DNA-binding GntR family transcriptional regulator
VGLGKSPSCAAGTVGSPRFPLQTGWHVACSDSRTAVPEDKSIPAAVRELVRDTIHSLEQLELLLRLQAEPTRALTVDCLSTELGLAPELCRAALQHLRESGLVHAQPPAHWQYAPGDERLGAAVRALADSYLQQRVELMMLIADDAVGRVRRGAREMFNETLRLRRKPEG